MPIRIHTNSFGYHGNLTVLIHAMHEYWYLFLLLLSLSSCSVALCLSVKGFHSLGCLSLANPPCLTTLIGPNALFYFLQYFCLAFRTPPTELQNLSFKAPSLSSFIFSLFSAFVCFALFHPSLYCYFIVFQKRIEAILSNLILFFLKKWDCESGMVVQVCNLSTWEFEAGGSL